MQHQVSTGSQISLSLHEHYRAAATLAQTLRLLYIDDARTAAITGGHQSSQDIGELEKITDLMKELLFDCARNAPWIDGVMARHPSIFENWASRVSEFRSLTDEAHERIIRYSDPKRLRELINRVPEEVQAAARDLEEQLTALRTGGRTEGDLSAAGRCAIYGMAAALAVAAEQPMIAFAAGFGIGFECL